MLLFRLKSRFTRLKTFIPYQQNEIMFNMLRLPWSIIVIFYPQVVLYWLKIQCCPKNTSNVGVCSWIRNHCKAAYFLKYGSLNNINLSRYVLFILMYFNLIRCLNHILQLFISFSTLYIVWYINCLTRYPLFNLLLYPSK